MSTFIKRRLHEIRNSFAAGLMNRLTKHWIIKIVFPVLMLGYFGVLDFFSEFQWIAKNKDVHFKIFGVFVILECLARIFDYARERCEESVTARRKSIVVELLAAVSEIVQTKVTRFREALPRIGSKSPFNVITQPIDQMNAIATRIEDLFKKLGAIPDDCLDVTILRLADGVTWEWVFGFQRNYKRPEANTLMETSSRSTAKMAYESGNEQFFASKQQAAAAMNYQFGERDRQKGDGSIYCKPVKIEAPDREEHFIVTFTSYGSKLCDPFDDASTNVWQMICREFARRIELELVLLCMKEWKERDSKMKRAGSPKTRKGRSG